MFGCRENAGKRRPLALPASGHDPLASIAVVHPQWWLVHRVSLSGSFQFSIQLSRPPSLGLSMEEKKRMKKKEVRGEGRK
jgi:hypothetical protein